jgi:hypothetical protein
MTSQMPTSRLDWSMFSLTVASASLLIPFRLEDADDDWDEVTEQLQAIQWKVGMV